MDLPCLCLATNDFHNPQSAIHYRERGVTKVRIPPRHRELPKPRHLPQPLVVSHPAAAVCLLLRLGTASSGAPHLLGSSRFKPSVSVNVSIGFILTGRLILYR